MAIRSLWLHKMRAFLSVLGIIIGTAAVIVLMAFGEGNMQDALDDIKRQGATNIIIQSIKPPDKANSNMKGSFYVEYGLTNKDYLALDTLPTVVRKVPMRIFRQEVRREGEMFLARVVATTEEYQQVNRFKMAAGRFLNDAQDKEDYGDDKKFANVAVLGAGAAAALFPFENPIGQDITLNKQRWIVVGVVADRLPGGSSAGGSSREDFNEDIYIPYDSSMVMIGKKVMLRQAGSRSGEIVEYHQITVQVAEMDDVRPTGKIIEQILQRNHDTKQDWGMTIPLDKLEEAERTKDRYLILLAFIGSISLLVGGIGIMNIMLATVTERTREIGIRRALGAKRRDITVQFLVEAVVQTGIGGLLGVLLGMAAVFGIPFVAWHVFGAKYPALLNVFWIFVALGVSVGVGVLFGWYPSRRAACLDPIEALRHM
jgi:putative ABC transport system permease protein